MLSRVATLYGVRPLRLMHIRIAAIAGGVLLLLLAGGLMGCGAAIGGGTTAPTTTTIAHGCPGGSGAGFEVTAPAFVLSLKDASHESTARVGEVIQVRLPATQRWSVAKDAAGVLELLQPAGYWDVKASACVWNFRAAKAGTTTVSFEGRALCKPGQMCPAYVVAEEFPLMVE